MRPFFTLIVPCYNAIAYIEQGIKSLENQTYNNFEVIFVDDCSIDNTFNFLLEYKSKTSLNVTVLKNDINCGPGQSRNNGIKKAKGSYITFMDSDDWLEETFFEEMHNCIIKNNADIVQCDFSRFYKGEKHWIKCTQNLKSELKKNVIIAQTVSSLCILAIKKDLFNDIKIPQLYNAEDVIIIPQLFSKATSVAFIHKPLYVYLYLPTSLSKKNDKKVVTSFINGFYELKKVIPNIYEDAIEFLGIKMVLYGASFNAIRIDMNKREIFNFVDAFINEYPDCLKNSYFKTLPIRKRFYIKAVYNKQYWLLYLYSRIHHLMLN